MLDAEDRKRIRGKHLDESILRHLRKMIVYSRHHRRRDMVWYYQEAWEFASGKIYGALPPRKQDFAGTFYKPSTPHIPESFRPPDRERPLRKIVKVDDRPYGFTTAKWEFLECGHERMAPVGFSNPVKRRRCIYCAFVSAQKSAAQKSIAAACNAKKRPASVPIAKAKAVSA
jgi:hypothetical protein